MFKRKHFLYASQVKHSRHYNRSDFQLPPLRALSQDPSDVAPLTPEHFSVRESLITHLEQDYTTVPTNRLVGTRTHVQTVPNEH